MRKRKRDLVVTAAVAWDTQATGREEKEGEIGPRSNVRTVAAARASSEIRSRKNQVPARYLRVWARNLL